MGQPDSRFGNILLERQLKMGIIGFNKMKITIIIIKLT